MINYTIHNIRDVLYPEQKAAFIQSLQNAIDASHLGANPDPDSWVWEYTNTQVRVSIPEFTDDDQESWWV